MKTVAHRGLSGLLPENSAEAFRAALPYRPDFMELDVQLSKDGEVVVFHDETLDRMERREGWLKDFTLKELKAMPVEVITLEEYFELIRGVKIDTFVEFKNSFVLYPGLEEKTLAVTGRCGRTQDCIFYSANHYSVMHTRELLPEARLCFPFDNWIYEEGAYCKKRNIGMTIPYHYALTKEIVDDFHENGVEVYPWTVDEPDEMRWMAEMGADGLLTNRVDVMNEVFGR